MSWIYFLPLFWTLLLQLRYLLHWIFLFNFTTNIFYLNLLFNFTFINIILQQRWNKDDLIQALFLNPFYFYLKNFFFKIFCCIIFFFFFYIRFVEILCICWHIISEKKNLLFLFFMKSLNFVIYLLT